MRGSPLPRVGRPPIAAPIFAGYRFAHHPKGPPRRASLMQSLAQQVPAKLQTRSDRLCSAVRPSRVRDFGTVDATLSFDATLRLGVATLPRGRI